LRMITDIAPLSAILCWRSPIAPATSKLFSRGACPLLSLRRASAVHSTGCRSVLESRAALLPSAAAAAPGSVLGCLEAVPGAAAIGVGGVKRLSGPTGVTVAWFGGCLAGKAPIGKHLLLSASPSMRGPCWICCLGLELGQWHQPQCAALPACRCSYRPCDKEAGQPACSWGSDTLWQDFHDVGGPCVHLTRGTCYVMLLWLLYFPTSGLWVVLLCMQQGRCALHAMKLCWPVCALDRALLNVLLFSSYVLPLGCVALHAAQQQGACCTAVIGPEGQACYTVTVTVTVLGTAPPCNPLGAKG